MRSKSKLELHATCKQHLVSREKWNSYILSKKNGSVHAVLSTAHSEQIEKNRKYVKTLIDLILFLARQGLAYRGHLESKDSNNQGIYIFFL